MSGSITVEMPENLDQVFFETVSLFKIVYEYILEHKEYNAAYILLGFLLYEHMSVQKYYEREEIWR